MKWPGDMVKMNVMPEQVVKWEKLDGSMPIERWPDYLMAIDNLRKQHEAKAEMKNQQHEDEQQYRHNELMARLRDIAKAINNLTKAVYKCQDETYDQDKRETK